MHPGDGLCAGKARCNLVMPGATWGSPMQPGDVPATWAVTRLLEALTGYCPRTDIQDGVNALIKWYLEYYRDVTG